MNDNSTPADVKCQRCGIEFYQYARTEVVEIMVTDWQRDDDGELYSSESVIDPWADIYECPHCGHEIIDYE